MNQDLYVFDGDNRSFTLYSDLNLSTGANIKSDKATPLAKRDVGYAISTYKEEFIFVSGGRINGVD